MRMLSASSPVDAAESRNNRKKGGLTTVGRITLKLEGRGGDLWGQWHLQQLRGSCAGPCPPSEPMCRPHASVLGPALSALLIPVMPGPHEPCSGHFQIHGASLQLSCVHVPDHKQHHRENPGISLSSPKPSLRSPGTGGGSMNVTSSLDGPHTEVHPSPDPATLSPGRPGGPPSSQRHRTRAHTHVRREPTSITPPPCTQA